MIDDEWTQQLSNKEPLFEFILMLIVSFSSITTGHLMPQIDIHTTGTATSG